MLEQREAAPVAPQTRPGILDVDVHPVVRMLVFLWFLFRL